MISLHSHRMFNPVFYHPIGMGRRKQRPILFGDVARDQFYMAFTIKNTIYGYRRLTDKVGVFASDYRQL